MAAGSILLIAMGSAVVFSARALPAPGDTIRERTDLAVDSDRIIAELSVAKSVAASSPTGVTFTIADRTGDSADDTIEYSWSGEGTSLRRRMNAGTWADLTPSLDAFELLLSTASVDEQVTTTVISTTGEMTLDSFSGWPGFTASNQTRPISATEWVAQTFIWAPPRADLTRVQISRVSFRLSRNGTSGDLQLTIHQSPTPLLATSGNRLGSPATIQTRFLGTTAQWADFFFSDVEFTPGSTTTLALVLSGINSGRGNIAYLNASGAPANAYSFSWSDTGGTLWGPLSGATDNDAPFVVTGRYSYAEQVRATVNRTRFVSASARLVRGTSATLSTAAMLNKPLAP